MERLHEHSPEGSQRYRLLWPEADGTCVIFPPSDRRPWIDIRGRSAWRTAYRLWPFEIPQIPHVGTYGVQLLTARGKQLPTPEPLLEGVDLEPVTLPGAP